MRPKFRQSQFCDKISSPLTGNRQTDERAKVRGGREMEGESGKGGGGVSFIALSEAKGRTFH